jgi:hypothetical protein
MCGADDGQHVVLADRSDGDSARQHQLVVALVVGEGRQVEGARAEQFGIGAGHAAGGAVQALGVGLDAERFKELGGGAFGAGQVYAAGVVDDAQRGDGRHRRLGSGDAGEEGGHTGLFR